MFVLVLDAHQTTSSREEDMMPLPPDIESDEAMERSPWEACAVTGEVECLCECCEPDRDAPPQLTVAS
jgi:hypothetical protein